MVLVEGWHGWRTAGNAEDWVLVGCGYDCEDESAAREAGADPKSHGRHSDMLGTGLWRLRRLNLLQMKDGLACTTHNASIHVGSWTMHYFRSFTELPSPHARTTWKQSRPTPIHCST